MHNGPLIASAWMKPDYRSALEKAGARIRELTPSDPLPESFDACDGLLLTGGVDVEPALYGEARHPSVETDDARDDYEIALARQALERNIPVLAICRGVQVLNVAAGGTLVQDIPSALPGTLTHQTDQAKNAIAHDVEVVPGTCLARLLEPRLDAQQSVAVNSRHHQSIKDLAPAFVVSATAPDGVVEGIEKPDADFCVGVQWHPENFWQTGEFGGLFEGLVQAAKRRARRRRT